MYLRRKSIVYKKEDYIGEFNIRKAEREYIIKVLKSFPTKKQAIGILKVSMWILRRKIKEHSISQKEFKKQKLMCNYQGKVLTIAKSELTAKEIVLGDLTIVNDGKDLGITIKHNGKEICYINEPGTVAFCEWLKFRQTEVKKVIIENYEVEEK